MRNLLLTILLFCLLAGCSIPTPTPAPNPTLEPIRVAISPVVGESGKYILHTCAWGFPSIVLFTEEESFLSPSVDVDLTLWWGNPNDYPTLNKPGVVAVPLGTESISIIVHQDNPITTFNAQDLYGIYTAQVRDWAEVSSENIQGEIQAWTYPNAHPLRQVFDPAIIPQNELTSHAQLAPSPTAMLEAIQDNPGAVGYVPSDFPVPEAKKISFQPQLEGFRQPILGITTGNPEGNLAALLYCLQNNFPTNDL